MNPQVFVCAGAGGVGKTTTSAALAVSLARSGKKTLIVTVDPARRLAQAMGVSVGPAVHPVHLPGIPEGLLYALMPEPQASTQTLIHLLFRREPEAHERFKENRIYRALQNAMAGIHDLTSLMLIASAAEDQEFECIVVDTAPSRYGLDFLTYPGRLAHLFEGRAVGWFGTLAHRSRKRESERPPGMQEHGLVAWGKKRVESALAKVLDPKTLLDLTHLFAELAIVRKRFAELARRAQELLLGPNTAYLVVATPSGAAEADVHFILKRLQELGKSLGTGSRISVRPPAPTSSTIEASAILLNRADVGEPPWVQVLLESGVASPAAVAVLEEIRAEYQARALASRAVTARFQGRHPNTDVISLPTIEDRDPTEIVLQLAKALDPHVALLERSS